MMGECTPVHQQIFKNFSKTVGITPLFQQVKISKSPPSSPSLIFTLATILCRKLMKSMGNSCSHTRSKWEIVGFIVRWKICQTFILGLLIDVSRTCASNDSWKSKLQRDKSLKETTEQYTNQWRLWSFWTNFWHGNAFGSCWFIGMFICLLWDKCWLALNSCVDCSCMSRSNHAIKSHTCPLRPLLYS